MIKREYIRIETLTTDGWKRTRIKKLKRGALVRRIKIKKGKRTETDRGVIEIAYVKTFNQRQEMKNKIKNKGEKHIAYIRDIAPADWSNIRKIYGTKYLISSNTFDYTTCWENHIK